MIQAAVAQTVWRGATEYPATAMPGEGLTTFARLLEERSSGTVRLRPAFDGPDGLRSATIPMAVQVGRLEVGDAFAGSLSAIDPIFQLSSLPFLATNENEAWRLYKAAKGAYQRVFAARGQRLMYATPWPASGIWSREPLDSPERLQGLAVRTYDPTSTAVMRGAGAAAVELSFADAMPRLRDGSIVAVLSSGDGGAGRKLWEYTRHFTAIGYAMPLSFTTLSEVAYQALTPAMRRIVDDAGADTEWVQWGVMLLRREQNYATMRTNGVVIAEASPALAAALATAATTVTQDWLRQAGPDAAAILNAFRP